MLTSFKMYSMMRMTSLMLVTMLGPTVSWVYRFYPSRSGICETKVWIFVGNVGSASEAAQTIQGREA